MRNYRPIALLHPASKLLERLVHQELLQVVSAKLDERQFGFRRHRSTEIQLTLFTEAVQRCLNEGGQIDAVALDAAKAFDKVPHHILLRKMIEMKVPNHLVNLTNGYLSRRQQRVVVDGQSSVVKAVTSGVPQGSILGPLLFLIFINDMPSHVDSILNLFADDTLLYRAINNVRDSEQMQADINSLALWSSENELPFNPLKSEAISLTRRRNTKIVVKYQLDGVDIPEVTTMKYLGVLLDRTLTMRDHVEYVTQKMRKRTGALRFLFGHRHQMAKLRAYKAVVLPVMTYCASVWLPWQKTFSDKLRKVTREFEHDLGIYDRSEEDRFAFHRILSPEKLREHRRLLLMYKIIKGIYPGKESIVERADQAVVSGRVNTRADATAAARPLHIIPIKSTYSPKKELESFSYSFCNEVVSLWNSIQFLPINLKSISNFRSFLFRRFFWISQP